jgi:hypothetical protein
MKLIRKAFSVEGTCTFYGLVRKYILLNFTLLFNPFTV